MVVCNCRLYVKANKISVSTMHLRNNKTRKAQKVHSGQQPSAIHLVICFFIHRLLKKKTPCSAR